MHNPINPTGEEQSVRSVEQMTKDRIRIIEEIEWLTRLNGHPDFNRLVASLNEELQATRASAKDIANHSTEQRDAYAQRMFGMEFVLTAVPRRLMADKANLLKLESELDKLAAAAAVPAPTNQRPT